MVDKRTENINLALDHVRQILNTVNHGSITLIVQNSYVVQIEKKEKIRLR
ncbi:YezD family protein [Lysinibacillus xylanilyticus]